MTPTWIIEAHNGAFLVLARRWRHNKRQLKRLAAARRRAMQYKKS